MLSARKTLFSKYVDIAVSPFHAVDPNILTILGSIPSLLFFVFVLLHWYVASLVMFLGNLLDLLDGAVARRYNKITAFGGFLDSFMDRLADFLSITAFAYGNIVRWEIVVPLLLFSYLTSYARSRGELASNRKVSFALGVIERSERLILIFIALLMYTLLPYVLFFGLNLAEIIFLFITILSLYTVIQRLMYAYKIL